MPELPEVETIRQGLAAKISQARIISCQAFRPSLRYVIPQQIVREMANFHICAIKRRAKYLIFELSNGYSMVSHLGMSGSWVVKVPASFAIQKHDHIIIRGETKDQEPFILCYNDPRRFGYVFYSKTDEIANNKFFLRLGIEPLGDELDGQYLFANLKSKKLSFKAALLDQSIIAGLGNIYVCEALWYSKISPLVRTYEFIAQQGVGAVKRLDNLADNIKRVLKDSLRAGGSSLRDYKNAEGFSGFFQNNFAVYNKQGTNCPDCGNLILRVKQNGRSTFYCASCQN